MKNQKSKQENFNFFGKDITQKQLNAINQELDRHQKAYQQKERVLTIDDYYRQQEDSYPQEEDNYPDGCSDYHIDNWS